MASPFPLRDTKVSGAIDRAFGELFTIEAFKAQSDVDSRKIPDVSRATMTDVVGVWEGVAKVVTPVARGSTADDVAHGWNASFPSVSIDEARLLWTPQSGDKVTRLFNGAIYTVAQPFPDQMGRVLLQLTSRKRT